MSGGGWDLFGNEARTSIGGPDAIGFRRSKNGYSDNPIPNTRLGLETQYTDSSRWCHDYVRALTYYNRQDLEDVIRLGNHMAMCAVGYRLSARELRELNFRQQSYVAGQLEKHQFISPAIAPELIDIFSHGVVPVYKGELPPNDRIARYHYVSGDTEKIVKNCGTIYGAE